MLRSALPVRGERTWTFANKQSADTKPMNFISITASLLLLAGISLAEEKPRQSHDHANDNPEEKAKVEEYKHIFGAAKEIIIYEGLPHPEEEEELLKVESKRNDTVRIPPLDEAFYTPAVEAVNADAIIKLLSGSDGIRINHPKKCGFHSDYCIQFKHQEATYRAFVCFGCGELLVMKGESGVTFSFNDVELKKLLTVYDKKRPKKVKVE